MTATKTELKEAWRRRKHWLGSKVTYAAPKCYSLHLIEEAWVLKEQDKGKDDPSRNP